MESILVKSQKKTFTKEYVEDGVKIKHVVTIRYDDECGNKHNSFSVTSDMKHGRYRECMCVCCHEEVAKHFPELAKYIKWHLVSSDGPMHYIANTLYWLGYSGWCDGKINSPPNLDYARETAVWPDMPESFLCDPDARLLKITRDAAAVPVKRALVDRLGALQDEFKQAVEELGFV